MQCRGICSFSGVTRSVCIFRVSRHTSREVKTKNEMYRMQRIYNKIAMCILRRKYLQYDICH